LIGYSNFPTLYKDHSWNSGFPDESDRKENWIGNQLRKYFRIACTCHILIGLEIPTKYDFIWSIIPELLANKQSLHVGNNNAKERKI